MCSFRLCSKFILFIFLLCFDEISHAQDRNQLAQQADKLYQSQQYAEAMRLYSQLLSLHPRDPFFSYRFGVSMLYADKRDLNKALNFIKMGDGHLDNEDRILYYYHLATAFHYTFRFGEAIKNYEFFIHLSQGNKKYASLDAERRIMMCRNGLKLLKELRDIYVIDRQHVGMGYFFRAYDMSQFHGRLLAKPEVLKTKLDRKLGDQSLVFLSDTQQVIYFSSYGKDGSAGRDIYMARRTPSGWSTPERLPDIINSPYDEDYPYLAPDGQTLYFSSKGHSTMGGYDIFYSKWDNVRKEWSKPVNLDFPINTPYDDFMFVTDSKMEYAYFASDRGSAPNRVHVYLVRIDIRPEKTNGEQIVQLLENPVSDEQYEQAVEQLQIMAMMEVNASREQFQKQNQPVVNFRFVDNHLYGLSENPTESEIIQKSFEKVAEAERQFLILRQKREALELLASRYAYQSQLHQQQARQILQQAETESNQQRRQELQQQYVVSQQKANIYKQRAEQIQQAAQQMQQTITAQEQMYRRMQMYAGDIQRLASAQMIDTSVVLFKKLVRDARIFDANVQLSLISCFPSQDDLLRFAQDLDELRQIIGNVEQQLLKTTQQLAQSGISGEHQGEQNIQSKSTSERQALQASLELMREYLQSLRQQEEKMQHAYANARSVFLSTDTTVISEFNEAQLVVEQQANRDTFLKKQFPDSPGSENAYASEQMTQVYQTGQEKHQQQSVDTTQNVLSNNQTQQSQGQQLQQQISATSDNLAEQGQVVSDTRPSYSEMVLQEYRNKNIYQRQHYLQQLMQSNEELSTKLNILETIAQWEQYQIISQEALLRMVIEKKEKKSEFHRQRLDEIARSIRDGRLSDSELLIQNISWEIESKEYQKTLQELSVLYGMQSLARDEFEKSYRGWQEILSLSDQAEKLQAAGDQKKASKVSQQIVRHLHSNQELWTVPSVNSTPELYAQYLETEIESDQKLLQQKQTQLREVEDQLADTEMKQFHSGKSRQQSQLSRKYEHLKLQQEQLRKEIQQIEQSIASKRREAEYASNFANIITTEMSLVQSAHQRLPTDAGQFKNLALESKKDTALKLNPFSAQFEQMLLEYVGLNSDQIVSMVQNSNSLFVPERSEMITSGQQRTNWLREVQRGYEYNIQATAMVFIRKMQFIDHQLGQTTDSTERAMLLQQRQEIRSKLTPYLQDTHIVEKFSQQQNLPALEELDQNIILMAQWISVLEEEKFRIASDTAISSGERNRQINILNDSISAYRKKLNLLAYHRQLYQLQLELLVMQQLLEDKQLSVVRRNVLLDTLNVLQRRLSTMLVFPGDVQMMYRNEQQIRVHQQQLDTLNNYVDNILRELGSDVEIVEKKASAMVIVRKFTDVQQTIEKKDVAMLSDNNQGSREEPLVSTTQQTQLSVQRPPVVDIATGQQQSQQSRTTMYVQADEQRSMTVGYAQTDAIHDIIYRVQFIALRRQAEENRFAQMRPVYEEFAGGLYRYLHGDYTDYQKAIRARDSIRAAGYSDAFIVAYRMGKRISLAEARQHELTTSSQQFLSTQVSQPVSFVTTVSGLPQGFYYMVQVGVFGRPRSSEQLFGIQPLHEERMENGYYRYYTGPFTTYEDAVRVQNTLRGSTVPDAFIVAFREGRRISVAEARQATGAGMTMWVQQTSITPADEVVFAVQLGSFEREQMAEVQKMFGQVCDKIQMLREDNRFIYYCGQYRTYEDARKLKDTFLNAGFSDVFVIALKNQRRVPLNEVMQNR